MNRIDAIVSNISNDDLVADIGCDQVEVGIMLAKKGIKSIGSDISKNVIENAKNKIKILNLENYIDLRVGNGLDTIKENESNTLVLAGMGAYTIIEILSNTKLRFNKIITISNNNNDELRIKMNSLNYRVLNETIIKEKNIYYNLIVFVQGKYDYNEFELLFGLNHTNEDMYNEYLEYLLKKAKNIKENSKEKNTKINKILKYLESR